jgi:hypothetical protein
VLKSLGHQHSSLWRRFCSDCYAALLHRLVSEYKKHKNEYNLGNSSNGTCFHPQILFKGKETVPDHPSSSPSLPAKNSSCPKRASLH